MDDNKGYFWFSEKQEASSSHQHTNRCKIDGKIYVYSEWKTDTSKSDWPDAIFLGYGEYYDSIGWRIVK